jgi:hypothetical protein
MGCMSLGTTIGMYPLFAGLILRRCFTKDIQDGVYDLDVRNMCRCKNGRVISEL